MDKPTLKAWLDPDFHYAMTTATVLPPDEVLELQAMLRAAFEEGIRYGRSLA